MAIADADRDLDTSSPRNLVEIQRAIGIEPAEMHRIPRPRRQRFDVRASDLDEIDLALRDESEMEQLGAEAIALARHEDQEAAIDQRGGEPVGGRARQPHPRGQFGQRDGAVDDLIENVEPAQQRLAALRRSEEHTSELQSLMRISYAVFCVKKKKHIVKTPQK